jgi:hypothetical protein
MNKSKVIEDPLTGKPMYDLGDFKSEKKRVGVIVIIILVIFLPTLIYYLYKHFNP